LIEPGFTAALDPTWEPVYTKRDPTARGTNKFQGTKLGHELITLQAVKSRHLLPLAVRPWLPLDSGPILARALLSEVQKDVPIGLLLADREFYTVQYLKLFLESVPAYVVPLPENKRNKREIIRARQISIQVEGRPETVYIDPDFIVGSPPDSVRTTVVYVFRPDEARKRPGKTDRPEHFVFATSGPVTLRQALERMDEYEYRWGIEVGNREQDRIGGKTRAERPALQWLFFLLSVILYGIWVFGRFVWVPPRNILRWELTTFMFRNLLGRCTRWKTGLG
jgi:hypothetical protein